MNQYLDFKGTKGLILQTLREKGSMSRTELMKHTKLSRATVSTSMTQLLESKLVRETQLLPSTGGRPAILVELIPYSHIILGADFTSGIWTLGAFDLLGNLIHRESHQVLSDNPDAVLECLCSKIPALVERFEAMVIPVIGMAMPGLVDTSSAIIHSAADLNWTNVNVGKMVHNKLGWPVSILNRHRAKGLAEYRYGVDKEADYMIYVGVGSGIAAGIFYKNQLIPGAFGGAGEVGHTTVDPNGPECACGNHGCLQALASTPAIEQETRKRLRSGEPSILHAQLADLQLLKIDNICEAAERGDQLAIKVLQKSAEYLGISLANLVNTINPNVLVLGGTIARQSQVFVDMARKTLLTRSMSLHGRSVVLRVSQMDDIGGALGAATFALDHHISYTLMSKYARTERQQDELITIS